MSVQLTDEFLAKIAGWEVVKQARNTLASGRVLSSNWTPPILKGVVQEGSTSYRSGLVLKDSIDIENLCSCRQSRGWGTICSHSVAVGLHYIRSQTPTNPTKPVPALQKTNPPKKVGPQPKRLLRAPHLEDGEELQIHVVFPPNLQAALPKGKIMLYLEAEWSRGRTPLHALPPNVAYGLTPPDARLLDLLEEIAGDTPGMLIVSHEQLGRILHSLTDTENVTLGKTVPLHVQKEPMKLHIKADLDPKGELMLRLVDEFKTGIVVDAAEPWILQNNTFRPLFLPAAARNLMKGPVRLDRTEIPVFLGQYWEKLEKCCNVEANFALTDFELVATQPEVLLNLTGGLAGLLAQLQFRYQQHTITVGAEGGLNNLWLPDPLNPKRYMTRNHEAETTALNTLLRLGFSGPHQGGAFQLAGQSSVLSFFASAYPRLQKQWTVQLEERLQKSTAQNLERVEPEFQVTSSGEQWFDLDVAFKTSGGERFSPVDIQRLLLSGQSHTRLKNGKFALIDTGAVEELQEVLLDCSPTQHDQKYRISNFQAGFLASALKDHPWKFEAPRSWRDRALQQTGEVKLPTPPLGKLEEVLRPYQKEGVAWLEFLRQNRFGGILADEMGLGKTLQTLAFLQTVHSRTPEAERKPSLIVCPTSLVFNWAAEAQKFTPDLKILPLQGPRRHGAFSQIAKADLVITSYALIRRDSDHYRGVEFDTVVLDEAQHIKNRQTQNAQAVKIIRSNHRLVLTGTPIENSVLDLWSIFDFLMPGYLGSAKDFKERYEVPIAKERNSEAQKRLNRRVRPFMLRRLKQEVAKDLPEKIEQVSFCELTETQQQVYQQILEASRQEIINSVEAQGFQKSRMVIFSALLRLRQICCDLRLLKLPGAEENQSSGKVELFNELLQEVIDGGHRVLVFSQFVEMLSILKERLQEQGVDYCYLDGSTPDRQKVVQQFQSTASIPVFLISLKAGGVGLNLTGADTVIHFDPWWNPAVEAQATDRAHRIGQTRVVTSYKLITRGTVEEKILNLQNKKREIIKSTLGGEEDLAGALTWEEMQELFH